ncbi:MAG TPA: phosphate signaling complex protein PhoU [Vicinamibacteria bacterium]|nr:phosphate signaling complex protein PhoU [Vicinamibacteria bacterium]
MPTTHTDRLYETELQQLREKLLDMSAKVQAAIAASVQALDERDTPLAQKVVDQDVEVDRLEVAIDDACRRLFALRQPAAGDLRFIATAVKIVTDLERMGDLAVNIAERAIDLNAADPLPPFGDMSTLSDLAEAQLKKALEAYVDRDLEKAETVLNGDDLIDAVYLRLFNELLTLMMEDSRTIRRATSVMFAAKQLERFADHAMNVAEMVIYMVRGTDVRHPTSRA